MASGNGDTAKRLAFIGPDLPQVGYGRMFVSLRDTLATKITLDDRAEHVVYAMQPDMVKGWYHGQRTTILTMWESDKLPPKFFEYLPQFETVIVPCLHNFDVFSQYHDNVHVIPLGVDRTVWHPAPSLKTGTFNILCGGSEWHRKGLDVVLDTFLKLHLPDATLHIKIVPPYRSAPERINHPNVVVHRDWMTLEDEVNLMRSMDCFVSASRGEGFGLMPLQAISTGIPTILTDAHGHREFSDLATHRITTSPSPAQIGRWADIGNWEEPNRDELADAIIDCYNNRDQYHAQALATCEQVSAFNWGTSANQLLQIVKPTTRTVDTNWVRAGDVTTPVRVNRRVKADIGAHHVDLAPGQTYHVVLNVRDVLKDAGYIVED